MLLRRGCAVALFPPLLLLVFAALLLVQLASTLLNPTFYRDELREQDVYERVHTAVFPLALDEFLSRQDEDLPDNLAVLDLPADPESRAVVLETTLEVVPPAFLQQTTEHILDQFLSYLFARSDEFEVNVSLSDPLRALVGHETSQPSRFEVAYQELEFGHVLVEGAVVSASGGVARLLSPEARLELVRQTVGDPDVVVGELDAEVFEAVDEIGGWLLGDTDTFRVEVGFDEFPALAVPLSPILGRSSAELLVSGFVLDESQLRADLEEADAAAVNDVDRTLALFTDEGWTYTQRALDDDLDARNAECDADVTCENAGGLDVDGVRTASDLVRGPIRWGAIATAALLALAIGFLGGWNWPQRLAWGSAAVGLAFLAIVLVAGPLSYAPRLTPEVHELLVSGTDDWTGSRQAFADLVVDVGGSFVEAFAGGIATKALVGLIVSAAVLAGALVWDRQRPAWDGT